MKQKENYDRQHRVRNVDPLPDDSPVWVTTRGTQVPGRVISTTNTPRSYTVSTPTGTVRRNRQHLNHRLNSTSNNVTDASDNLQDLPQPERDKIMTRTQTGTLIRVPDRLMYN